MPIVLAMTGASGAPYAVRLLQVLCRAGRTVHLTISESGAQVLREEMGLVVSLKRFDPGVFGDLGAGRIHYHHVADFSAGIASGSFRTGGMVVAPCSMSTLAAIAHGITTNLITRAADVHLKERRPLLLVPRETPLSLVHLENMTAVTRAGAVVLPAMPGWYHQPKTLDDLIAFVVGRICDQLGIDNDLIPRWGDASSDPQGEETTDGMSLKHSEVSRNALVTLVTGASAGIGKAVARRLAGRGHRLALTARRADRLEDLASELRSQGAEVLTIPADLADPETPRRLVAAVVERFGQLDVLINNAGYGLPEFFGQSSPEELRKQIDVNLSAPILLTREALPLLIDAKGTVINIGSGITSVANPVFGVYGTTKAGLAYWNDALRREVRHKGVRVCLVEPGPVDTEFFDAVKSRVGGEQAKGVSPPPDNLYNALRDRPPMLFSATVEEAARRIVRLLDHPKRRLSFLKRRDLAKPHLRRDLPGSALARRRGPLRHDAADRAGTGAGEADREA